MITEIIITVLAAFIMVAIVINILAIVLYIISKCLAFACSPTGIIIFLSIRKALSTVWKVAFFPAIWVFERL